MSQASDTNNTPATESKADATAMQAAMDAAKPAKNTAKAAKPAPKQAAKQAPAVRQVATQAQRAVVTFETARRICPTEGMVANIARAYGLDGVDYEAVRSATEQNLAASAKILADNMGERFDKPLEMHMQRTVDGFVRSAHGAGSFFDTKAKAARDATSAIANEDRDEDRDGVDGGENKAQRACRFAAEVALQAYALLAAAHGAIDAYAHVCGQDWKPYAPAAQAPGQSLSQQAIKAQANAFTRD